MTVSWPDYPSNWGKPGHVNLGYENEAILDRLASLNPAQVTYKTADETIISTGTYQDDDHLYVTVEAGGVYVFTVEGAYNSGVTPDFRYQFSVPSGTFSGTYFQYFDASNAMVRSSYSVPATGAVTGLQGKVSDTPFEFGGVYTCGSTGGTMQWQWAQDVSTASNTVVRAGSRFSVTRVA
jgi:hypothetical protein